MEKHKRKRRIKAECIYPLWINSFYKNAIIVYLFWNCSYYNMLFSPPTPQVMQTSNAQLIEQNHLVTDEAATQGAETNGGKYESIPIT